VKFNAGQSGFYRVAYSAELSQHLGAAIKAGQLSAADRFGIQSDAFALARSGAIPLAQVLELIENYIDETDYSVWSDLSTNLAEISTLLDGTEAMKSLDKYVLGLYSKISSLGWNTVAGESDLNKQLRSVVLNKLAQHGDASVVAEAKKRFEAFLKDPTSLSGDLQGVVFKTAMRHGGKAEFDAMVKLYQDATQPDLRFRALQGIGFAIGDDLVHSALDFALSDGVRSQDIYMVFATVASTSRGRELAWLFLKKNWDVVVSKLEAGMNLLANVISYATKSGNTTPWLVDVESFLATRKRQNTERAIAQVLESIKSNITYLDRNIVTVSQWLLKHTV